MRRQIHEDVLAKGFDQKRNTFTQYYGSKELDASLLMIPLVHFLPSHGPADARHGRGDQEGADGRRFRDALPDAKTDDGLPPGEGSFLACTFWLIDNLALSGQLEEATEMFERMLSLRNDVGLLSEEYDTRRKRLVGNFPQAFTHVGLVNSAYNLDRARKSRARALRTA